MKQWMIENHGNLVTTKQYDKKLETLWEPGVRKIDASRSTYVLFDESRRDYKGMKLVSKDTDKLIVEDDWHKIKYEVVN